ncbi:hypothetical protein ACZ11_09230 [Lysinibacillus xylanilyticus]|uniref:Uncharacterized protein n=1 Tax=Lysinibacillus xylanilyticus TaxID=582475 RepID=A0A0K9FDI1_9BACI|nr:hypothetical protein [Lysinibacillus xylanilyticus]KMY32312.1 hypothetical protein ACZ11_09230 [Lysinibacillus xylanilyticus]
MNSLYGTFRLVSEEALFYLGKLMFLYITIPLTLLWVLIGYIFGLGDDVVASISGPAYFFIALFGVNGYRSMYPVAIGMGSTRVQLLKVYYGVGILTVVISITFLNVLQYILKTLYLRWEIGANILHPGLFLIDGYHFLAYLWIDLMFGLFLFGVPFLLYSIYFRLGLRKSIIILMLLSVIFMVLYYGSYLSDSMEWFLELYLDASGMTLVTLLGLFSVGALLLSYPIMRNAPLKSKSRKD